MKTRRKLKWDIGWIGKTPTDAPEDAGLRLPFFVYCMHCDKQFNKYISTCKTKQSLLELFKGYVERIDLSSVGFSMKDTDIERLVENTWNDVDFQMSVVCS